MDVTCAPLHQNTAISSEHYHGANAVLGAQRAKGLCCSSGVR